MFTFDLLTIKYTYQDLLRSPSPSAPGVRVVLSVQELHEYLVNNETPGIPILKFTVSYPSSSLLPSFKGELAVYESACSSSHVFEIP